jgi:sec-independent protein translocase protein TatA
VPSLGVPELLLVLGVAILLFGSSRLPRIGRSIGEAISNFRGALRAGDPPRIDD